MVYHDSMIYLDPRLSELPGAYRLQVYTEGMWQSNFIIQADREVPLEALEHQLEKAWEQVLRQTVTIYLALAIDCDGLETYGDIHLPVIGKVKRNGTRWLLCEGGYHIDFDSFVQQCKQVNGELQSS